MSKEVENFETNLLDTTEEEMVELTEETLDATEETTEPIQETIETNMVEDPVEDTAAEEIEEAEEEGKGTTEEIDEAREAPTEEEINTTNRFWIEHDTQEATETETKSETKRELLDEHWMQVYASRQNRTILEVMASGVETHNLYEEKIYCIRVNIGNIKGLIPIMDTYAKSKNELQRMVGQIVPAIVTGIIKESNLCFLSHTAAVEKLAARTWKDLREEQVREGRVTKVNYRRATLDISGVPAILEAKDYSWGWTDDLREKLKINQVIEVKITDLDQENKKVTVSRKVLLPDPWPHIENNYRVGDETLGQVTGVVNWGIFVNIAPGIDALTNQSSFDPVAKGDWLLIRLTKIDSKKREISARIVSKKDIIAG